MSMSLEYAWILRPSLKHLIPSLATHLQHQLYEIRFRISYTELIRLPYRDEVVGKPRGKAIVGFQ
jgi:hypothetical protein